jgi:dolichol-phosphate mannosyltransferase
MSAPVKLSVVCPAFNEEEVLPLFHAELCAVLATLQRDYEAEIIYVDDGSRDGTLEVLRRLAAADARVRYLSFSRNFGHQAALTAGLEHARGEVVVSMDSDLQHPPALLPTLLAKWREGNDLVLTLRQDDPRLNSFKRLSSRAFYRILRWLSDTEVRAAASDFRLMSRKALDALLRLHETHRFLRGMVNWLGFPTATVSFMPAGRAGGVSKYTLRRMLTLALDGMLSFSKVPLRLALLLGVLLFVLGLGQGAYTLGRALFTPAASGTAVVLTALFLVGGCVLAALGVLGEYVGRIYEQVKGRPHYLLKEMSPPAPAAARSRPPGAAA